MQQEFLTLKEVSEYLSNKGVVISLDGLRKKRSQGRFDVPALKLTKQFRYRKADVDKWIDKLIK